MKKIFIVLLFMANTVFAQEKSQGVITYKHTTHWVKIYAGLDYLSQEEKDREMLTWGNNEGYTTKMNLFFSPTKTLYTHASTENENSTYSWRKNEFIVSRNFESKTLTEVQEMIGKTYIITDSLQKIKWKVLNDLKEVQGHMCMKALYHDEVKNYDIIAWFAVDMPISTGPELLYGLPGVILEAEYDNGKVIIEADKIEYRDVEKELKLPKKLRGKKITIAEGQALIKEHIKVSIASKRNPYWAMRF